MISKYFLYLGSLTLQGLNQLEEINLSNNKLRTIFRGAFQSLHHLKVNKCLEYPTR